MAKPIGIFDSGLGGLTVARAISGSVPGEDLVYLGDTARVPYGTRSAKTVVRYAIACAERLLSFDIKLLVVACNTASGVALGELQQRLDIPVVGVIQPGARAGVQATRTGRIGILATSGTVASGAYERAILAENQSMNVFARPAPLFVPLAEEGWVTGDVPRLAARRYLQPLVEVDVDTIVLGCTHYPLLSETIHEVAAELLGHDVTIVDSAQATASALTEILDLPLSRERAAGSLEILVTDLPGQFGAAASRFLGKPIEGLNIQVIDL
ncbi:MAG: glutamate racemase [Deltaproteobacteria bacterium]|nr:glutamate racemase [Deltaproteobacteria bacterium]NND27399.1 glutamate racemase [Myxococcales bacterium]MBT8465134.1 glutamate racemase [Deltaproteobacteria bacterium]MBT8480205.1 glutamate racemase [Deltaproteobacteria bacterium]NNK06272.1 glutamate racemase [Myxococcales bacterium]